MELSMCKLFIFIFAVSSNKTQVKSNMQIKMELYMFIGHW